MRPWLSALSLSSGISVIVLPSFFPLSFVGSAFAASFLENDNQHVAPPSLPSEDAPPTAEPASTTSTEAPSLSTEAPSINNDDTGEADVPEDSQATGPSPSEDKGIGSGLESSASFDDEQGDEGSDPDEHEGDPRYVEGRRAPMLNTLRGSVGLFYTSLPDVGGKHTFRFRTHTDFFRKQSMFCCESDPEHDDSHSRVRGTLNLGFTLNNWSEVYAAVHGAASRNEREQTGRQDPTSLFALGDLDFGFKAAHGFKDGGVGLGGQIGFGLLSGTDRLLAEKLNFNIDLLFALDLRYLTEKQAPVRFSANLGYKVDNSTKLVDWATVTDDLSREVLRYGLGVDHSRLQTRLAVDFPFRFGERRQFGIDPILEYAVNVSTHQEDAFLPLTEKSGESVLPRVRSWLTLGLRSNLYQGLFIDAAVDVATTSPNFEFGPPVAPWQAILGLGWSFDPKPIIREVPVEVENDTPPPAIPEGRIVGRIVNADGEPVSGATIHFPGHSSNAIISDESGSFISYRFPDGNVLVRIESEDNEALEEEVAVQSGEDTQLELVVTKKPVVESVITVTLLSPDGQPIPNADVQIKGEDLDEPFNCCDSYGRFAVRLPAGEYTGSVQASGYPTTEFSFVLGAESLEKTVTLENIAEPAAPTSPTPSGNEWPNIRATKKSIRLKGGIRYKGSTLAPASSALLDEFASFLKAKPEYSEISIIVHTDDRGNPIQRSRSRAEAIKAALIERGVDGTRIRATGRGASNPVAVNLTPEGRRKNNRTIIRVSKYQE